jgi:uncharacterized protein (DUF1778 family)
VLKDKAFSNKPRTEVSLKESTQEYSVLISSAEVRRAMNNVFIMRDACPQAEGNRFQHLL